MKKLNHKPQIQLLVGGWHLMHQKMAFGNPTAGTIPDMDKALRMVKEVNDYLVGNFFPTFAVSAHWNHELQVPKGNKLVGKKMSQFNSARSISLKEWEAGVKTGIYPKIGRLIPPGFGYPWSDDGAFVNEDPEVREYAHKMMVFSLQTSAKIKKAGSGLGEVIYWTGPDGIKWRPLVEKGIDPVLSYETVSKLHEWKMITQGVGTALKEARKLGLTNELILVEGKPGGDPCYLDVMLDPRLESECIKEINKVAGCSKTPQAVWQNEFCHARSGGVRFVDSLKYAIKAGTFQGHIHFNSGGLGQVDFRKLLRKGTNMSKFPQYVDPDYLPGQGPTEWINDQIESLRVAVQWSMQTGKPVFMEFDARFIRYENCAEKLAESAEWTVRNFYKESGVILMR